LHASCFRFHPSFSRAFACCEKQKVAREVNGQRKNSRCKGNRNRCQLSLRKKKRGHVLRRGSGSGVSESSDPVLSPLSLLASSYNLFGILVLYSYREDRVAGNGRSLLSLLTLTGQWPCDILYFTAFTDGGQVGHDGARPPSTAVGKVDGAHRCMPQRVALIVCACLPPRPSSPIALASATARPRTILCRTCASA
jgi:hypothetical protein